MYFLFLQEIQDKVLMRRIILLFLIMFITSVLFAQEIKTVSTAVDKAKEEAPADTAKHHWKLSGFGFLTANQAAYSY